MIEPVSPARFPCEEIPRHRKKAQKHTPKKADHKHDFSRKVVLCGYSRYATLDRAHGFVGGVEYAAGSQCPICGKVRLGFPGESRITSVSAYITLPWGDMPKRKLIIKPEFASLPVVDVNNLIDLEVKTNGC